MKRAYLFMVVAVFFMASDAQASVFKRVLNNIWQEISGPWHSRPRIVDSYRQQVMDDGDSYLYPRTVDAVAFKYHPNAPKSGFWMKSNPIIRVNGPIRTWDIRDGQIIIWPDGSGGNGYIEVEQDYYYDYEGSDKNGTTFSSDLRRKWVEHIQEKIASKPTKDTAGYEEKKQQERELYLDALEGTDIEIDSSILALSTDKLRKKLKKADKELAKHTQLAVRNLWMSDVTDWPKVIKYLEGKLYYDNEMLRRVRLQERTILVQGIMGSAYPDPTSFNKKSIKQLMQQLKEENEAEYNNSCRQIQDMLLNEAVRRAMTSRFELIFNPVYNANR